MHWGDNGDHRQCRRGRPSEKGRGWGWDGNSTISNRAEEEELQGSLGFFQTDSLANRSLLPLLVPMPHHSVCLLLHHPLSCPTTVSNFLEQDFLWSRCVQLCAFYCLVAFKWLTTTFSFSFTVTYDFLAIEDASRDKVMDVLFVLRNTEGSQNNTCAGAGMKCSPIFNIIFWGNKRWIALYVCFVLIQRYCVFSRSAIAMCVCVSNGWDRWSDPVGASTGSWVPLGPVWSGQRYKQNLGLPAVPFWPTLSCWQIHWLVTYYSIYVLHITNYFRFS